MKISFFAAGLPAPQGSKSYMGKGCFKESSKNLAPWREAVKYAALKEWSGKSPIEGPVFINIMFHFLRPKSHRMASGRIKESAPDYKISTPDVDKLCRGVFDALADASIVVNDSQFQIMSAVKVYSDIQGAQININTEEKQ